MVQTIRRENQLRLVYSLSMCLPGFLVLQTVVGNGIFYPTKTSQLWPHIARWCYASFQVVLGRDRKRFQRLRSKIDLSEKPGGFKESQKKFQYILAWKETWIHRNAKIHGSPKSHFLKASQVSSTNPNWHFVCASVNPTGTQIRPCPQLFWACIRIPFPTSACVFLLKRGAFFVDPKRLPMSRNIPSSCWKGRDPAVWEGRFEVTVNPVMERDGWWDVRLLQWKIPVRQQPSGSKRRCRVVTFCGGCLGWWNEAEHEQRHSCSL